MEKDSHEIDLASLGAFKDWSNYLLVTTVAAAGWLGKTEVELSANRFELWCLALSACFGIFTLALIPIITSLIREIDGETKTTFYDITADFELLGGRGMKIKWVCFWQHFLFLIGVLAFAVHRTFHGYGFGICIDIGIYCLLIGFTIWIITMWFWTKYQEAPKPVRQDDQSSS
jgi:hypothetical protein